MRLRAPWVVALAVGGCMPPKAGVLRFSGTPADALVTIDDHYVGKLVRLQRFGVKLPPGQHRVTIEASGFFPHDELVRVPEGGGARINVTLDPIPD